VKPKREGDGKSEKAVEMQISMNRSKQEAEEETEGKVERRLPSEETERRDRKTISSRIPSRSLTCTTEANLPRSALIFGPYFCHGHWI
jgi:hypothetical protein